MCIPDGLKGRGPTVSAAHHVDKVSQGHSIVCSVGGEACGSREEGTGHLQPGEGGPGWKLTVRLKGRLPGRGCPHAPKDTEPGGTLKPQQHAEPGAAEWDGRGSSGTLG